MSKTLKNHWQKCVARILLLLLICYTGLSFTLTTYAEEASDDVKETITASDARVPDLDNPPTELEEGQVVEGNEEERDNELNAEMITVRLGFFHCEGYHEMNEEGTRFGYGYDFSLMATRYANMNFEYVGYENSKEEMFDMLDRGEIDVLGPVYKSEKNSDKYVFSSAIGSSSVILNTRADNIDVVPGLYSTYEGIRIGMLPDAIAKDRLVTFAEENGFSYESVYYDTEVELAQALQAGDIDAAVSTSLRITDNEKTISEFSSEDYYCIACPKNLECINRINYAISEMNATEGDWKSSLYYENFVAPIRQELQFNEQEQMFIERYSSGGEVLRVSIDDNFSPISEWTGTQYVGIIPDYWDALMNMIGINYEYVRTNSGVRDEQQILDGEADIYLVYVESEKEAQSSGLLVSKPFLSMGVACVSRRDLSEINTISLAETNPALNNKVLSMDYDQVKYYSSSNVAIDAVRVGEVDATYVYAYAAEKYLNSDSTGLLTYTTVPGYEVDLCAVIPAAQDHTLVSIVSKCIENYSENEVNSIISKHISYVASNLTLADYSKLHPVMVSIFILLVLGLFITVVFSIVHISNRNIREKAQLEQQKELKKALAKAEESNKAKTIFLSNMSHDIRTPMNAIIGFTTMAKMNITKPEQVGEYLEKIEVSGNHLLALINDVLDMSRIESGKVTIMEEPVNLFEVMEDLNTIIRADAAKKNLNFSLDYSKVANPAVICDRLHLNQVLLNIVANAIKFTKEGGSIRVSVEQKGPCEGSSDGSNHKTLYIFEVSDTGIGMSKEFMENMFEPFEREKNTTVSGIQGTGLGLSITRSIVEMMGGSISVESELDVGSDFKVCIPLAFCKEDRISLAKERLSQAERGQEVIADIESLEKLLERHGRSILEFKLLVVEDNELNCEIIAGLLGGIGLRHDIVNDGEVAVERMSTVCPNTYDIILMDIQMPVMNGYEACRAIRQLENTENANIPIAAMTANAFDEDRRNAMEAGMNGHISKPIVIEDMMKTILEILTEKYEE